MRRGARGSKIMLSMRQSPWTSATRPSSGGTLCPSQTIRRSMSSIVSVSLARYCSVQRWQLAGEIAAGLAVIGKTGGGDVDSMKPGEALVHGVINRPPARARQFGQRRVPEDAPVDEDHQKEGGADHAVVLAQRERARGRKPGPLQRLEHAKLALDHMRALQELARRLAAQHVSAVRRIEKIGRVRLAGGEFLCRARGPIALDMGAEPDVERARVRRKSVAHRTPASLV